MSETLFASSKPFVIRNGIKDWEAAEWTPDKLSEILGNEKVSVRFGPMTHTPGEILWETKSPKESVQLSELLEWSEGKIRQYLLN